MALPILSNWLSRKIRYSLMATIVFRFMIGSNVEQLKFDLSTSLVFAQADHPCVRGLRESMRVMNKVLKIAHLNHISV